jgi:hypothetical protein
MIFPVTRITAAKERSRGARRRAALLITIGALPALALAPAAHAACSNEQLRQSPRVSNIDPATGEPYDASLPECRAYEQVSPAEKDGASGGVYDFDSAYQGRTEVPALPMHAVADGSMVTYPGEPAFSVETREVNLRQQYTSTWSPSGWITHIGDELPLEEVPAPVLPSAAETSTKFVEDAGGGVVEETPSGSKVFFLDGANTGANESDLYAYTVPSPSVPSGRLEDLTADKLAEEYASVGLLGVGGEGAEEGSYVYFVAGGALVPGAPNGGCTTNFGLTTGTGCNLFLRHDGVTTFIATLSPEDEDTSRTLGTSVIDWGEPGQRTAEVSPNGRYVAFGSEPGRKIFRYDADAAEKGELPIVCVSCPGGGLNLVSLGAGITNAGRQRYMLNDGRVLFDSSAALVPEDVGGQTQVYEYEPEGIGSCTPSTNTNDSIFIPGESGCVSLISGGTSRAAILTDASANGSDIFFTTTQSLVPQDGDEIDDMYDAREGGGFTPPPEPACSAADECPGPIATPPVLDGTPTSATFSGTEALPPSPLGTTKPPPPPTRAQKLVKALKACHAKRSKPQRTSCEATARKLYGPIPRGKKAKHRKDG